MSKPDFLLFPAARRDLQQIWRYASRTWREDQADRYIDAPNDAFVLLASDPELGSPCDHIRRDYSKRVVGHHMIYFKVADDGVQIVRVLHERMDVERHL